MHRKGVIGTAPRISSTWVGTGLLMKLRPLAFVGEVELDFPLV